MQGEMRGTITFEAVEGGPKVAVVQENAPTVIQVEHEPPLGGACG